jgi:uncharacterized phiE125 gp8 family phage protein
MPIQYSKVTVGPAVEPVDADSIAKLDLKVDQVEEDGLIDILIQAARELVEEKTQTSLITQTRVMKLDYFPDYCITLPFGPVQSVTSITYYDDNEDSQTFSSSNYYVDTDSKIARVIVKDSWPSTYDRPGAVTITYVCGYGLAGSNVPAPLRKAILLLVGHFYENRQNVIVSGSPTGVIEIPFGAEVLIAPYVREQNIMY